MPVITEGESLRRVLKLLNEPERCGAGPSRPPWGPEPAAQGASRVTGAIAARSAVRSYDQRPLDAGLLGELLREAAVFGSELTVLVDARRVEDRAPGTYRAEPTDGFVLPAQAAFPSVPGLGDQYADAPVLLMICGDLTAACESDGANGYSRLLVQAGVFGHAAWLAAVSRGLVGCVFGRSHHGATTAVRRVYGMRHLFTVAVGHSLPPAQESTGVAS